MYPQAWALRRSRLAPLLGGIESGPSLAPLAYLDETYECSYNSHRVIGCHILDCLSIPMTACGSHAFPNPAYQGYRRQHEPQRCPDHKAHHDWD